MDCQPCTRKWPIAPLLSVWCPNHAKITGRLRRLCSARTEHHDRVLHAKGPEPVLDMTAQPLPWKRGEGLNLPYICAACLFSS